MNGKGDSPRPVDRDRYEENYDEIKWDDRCSGNCQGSQERGGDIQASRVECQNKQVPQEPKPVCNRHKCKKKGNCQSE